MTAPLNPLNGVASLPHLGVIRVAGEDAAAFLHGQLTQDFALLDERHARLAAYLTAKGRMQASFIGFKRGGAEVLLVCARDLLAPTLKRLSMFVLRAKALLTDATADFALYGQATCCTRCRKCCVRLTSFSWEGALEIIRNLRII